MSCFRIVATQLFALAVVLVPAAIGQESSSPVKQGRWTVMGVVVDESGRPAAGATLRPPYVHPLTWDGDWPVTTNDRGVFQIKLKAGTRFVPNLIATSADGQQMGWHPMLLYEEAGLLNIQLGPVHQCRVRVVDSKGDPVTDARVAPIQGAATALTEVPVDSEGVATLRLPPDMDVFFVYAVADDGFNYIENIKTWPARSAEPLPESITIPLLRGKTIEIKMVGSDGAPITGLEVSPWTMTLPNRLTRINGLIQCGSLTDDDGIARFDWVPENFQRSITFTPISRDYHVPQNANVPAGGNSGRATSYRVGIVRGKVSHADGSPAAHVMIQGEGRGNTNMYFRDSTMTGADGHYELKPYPDQTLTIAVVDDRWAAKSKSGLKLAEGEVVDDVDFTLITGTRVTGTVTVGEDDRPVVNDNATLVQDPDAGSLVRWAYTNAAGRYEFRIGPGTYRLQLPLVDEPQMITVTDEEELVFDGHADRPARMPIAGVVKRADGSSAANVTITSAFIGGRGRSTFKARTDDQGKFSGQRATRGMLLLARDETNNAAAVVELGPDDPEAEMTLAPAKTVTGRLVDADGKPLVNVGGMLQYDLTDGEATITINAELTVSDESVFTAAALPQNAKHGVVRVFDEKAMKMGSADIAMDEELGDIRLEMQKIPQRQP